MSWKLWSKRYTQQWQVERRTTWYDELYQSLSSCSHVDYVKSFDSFYLMIFFFFLVKWHTRDSMLLTAYLKMIFVYLVICLWFHGSIWHMHLLSICIVFARKRSDIAKEQNTRTGFELTPVHFFKHQKICLVWSLLNQDY